MSAERVFMDTSRHLRLFGRTVIRIEQTPDGAALHTCHGDVVEMDDAFLAAVRGAQAIRDARVRQ